MSYTYNAFNLSNRNDDISVLVSIAAIIYDHFEGGRRQVAHLKEGVVACLAAF
jgi:hypothetical protein